MAPRLDFSPLYSRPAPSAFQMGLSNIGGIMTAMMERRRREQELEAEQAAKAQELQFRQDQEKRLVARQEAQDKQAEARATAQEQRDQQAQRIKGYEAVSKAKTPQERAFLAQLYGGTVEQAKPNYLANPEDPLGPNIDFLENVQDSPNRRVSVGGYEIDGPEDPLGFSYGINPEHERRTQQAARTQVMTMPGGQPINLPDPEEEEDHFTRLERQISMLPPGSPQQQDALMRLREARALQLDPKATYGSLQDGRTMAQRAELASRRGRGGGGAGKPSDVRGDFTAFRGAATQWETAANVDKLTDAWDKFRELSSNVEDANRSGDTISRKSALYQAARYITGPGVLTPAEFENTVQRTGGSIGSLLTELEKRKSGDISDIEAAALEKFVTNAKSAVQRRAANAVKDYDRRFGAGLAAKNPTMKEERDAYRSSLLQRFEIADPSAPQGNAVGIPKALMKPADLERLNGIKVR
jgi:hypothetical protein